MPFVDVFCDHAGGGGVVNLPTGDFLLDIEFIPVARDLIEDFVEKDNAVWVSVAEDDVNVLTPWNAEPGVATEYGIRMLFFPENRVGREFQNYVPESVMNKGYVYGIMYDYGFPVRLKDKVIFNDQYLTVESINPIQPVDKSIIFIVVLGA